MSLGLFYVFDRPERFDTAKTQEGPCDLGQQTQSPIVAVHIGNVLSIA
jgi:hypothetical protein